MLISRVTCLADFLIDFGQQWKCRQVNKLIQVADRQTLLVS